jgi:hypothetical protein
MSDRGPLRAVQFTLRPGLPHNSPRRPQSCVTSLAIAGAQSHAINPGAGRRSGGRPLRGSAAPQRLAATTRVGAQAGPGSPLTGSAVGPSVGDHSHRAAAFSRSAVARASRSKRQRTTGAGPAVLLPGGGWLGTAGAGRPTFEGARYSPGRHTGYGSWVAVYCLPLGVVQISSPGWGWVRCQPGVCLVWWCRRQRGWRLHSQVLPPWW